MRVEEKQELPLALTDEIPRHDDGIRMWLAWVLRNGRVLSRPVQLPARYPKDLLRGKLYSNDPLFFLTITVTNSTRMTTKTGTSQWGFRLVTTYGAQFMAWKEKFP
jgi:hypothetical protein